jgi:hypothetical protein
MRMRITTRKRGKKIVRDLMMMMMIELISLYVQYLIHPFEQLGEEEARKSLTWGIDTFLETRKVKLREFAVLTME